jgi:Mrp family chromosome partitioning ATPase
MTRRSSEQPVSQRLKHFEDNEYAFEQQIAEATRIRLSVFDVMITRSPVSCSADLLASPAFQWILEVVDQEYDFVLFDSPPLVESADVHLHAIR